jgi:hypothetical protein
MALIVYQTSQINSKKVEGLTCFSGAADRPGANLETPVLYLYPYQQLPEFAGIKEIYAKLS